MNRLILSSFFILFLFSCTEQKEEYADAASQEPDLPFVTLSQCSMGSYIPEFESYGTISYVKKADVFPMSSEIIREMGPEEGDRVNRGDILVRMDKRKLEIQQREAQAGVQIRQSKLNLSAQQLEEGRRNMEAQFHSIESTRLDLKRARADFERILSISENKKKLFELEGISREEMESVELELFEKELALQQAQSNLAVKMIGYRDEDLLRAGYELPDEEDAKKRLFIDYNTRMLAAEVDVARAELDAAESQLETLELYLEETVVRAPIGGVVGQKYMEEGEKASPDKALYLIFPESSVYAVFEVSERDMQRMHPGQTALVCSDSLGEADSRGEVYRISPWIREETRTAAVRILLDNSDLRFKVGQFVRVKVLLSDEITAVMIPREALIKDESESFVYLYRGGRIFKKSVECGEPIDSSIPVFSGLEEGDYIVSSPREGYRDGMKVRQL